MTIQAGQRRSGLPVQPARRDTLVTPGSPPQGVDEAGLGQPRPSSAVSAASRSRSTWSAPTGTSGRSTWPHRRCSSTGQLADPVKIAALREWYPRTRRNRSRRPGRPAVAVAQPREPGDTDLEVHAARWGRRHPRRRSSRATSRRWPRRGSAGQRGGDGGGALPAQPVVVFNQWFRRRRARARPGRGVRPAQGRGQPVRLDFGAQEAGDRAGGVIAPNVGITALSRAKGPIGGNPDTFQDGDFDPTEFFPSSAPLLGDVTLPGDRPQGPADFASDRVIRSSTVDTRRGHHRDDVAAGRAASLNRGLPAACSSPTSTARPRPST